jgi:ribosomal protein S18 acetylase RimI-like enzyme
MENNKAIVLRKGEARDIPFIIDAIVAAEKSGSEIFSYSKIFEMTENEVRKYFAAILAEDVPGQELCYSEYMIAEVNGTHAGAIAGWIEGESGQAAGMIKAMLLNHFLPKENMVKALEKRKYLEQMRFNPEFNSFVIESGYTLPAYRGKGILAKLIMEQIHTRLQQRPDVKKSYVQVAKTNRSAIKIYENLGYQVVLEKKCSDPVILNWLPGDTQIIMEKHL